MSQRLEKNQLLCQIYLVVIVFASQTSSASALIQTSEISV